MGYVIYEATLDLVSYHLEGVSYTLDFEISDLRPPNGDVMRARQESISGKVETNWFGDRRIWQVTTIPYKRGSAQALVLREFLRSTSDGQDFTFDPYGFADNPVETLTVSREDDGFTEEKFQEIDGPNDYVRYGFSVREV